MKKFLNLEGLTQFLDNLKTIFATQSELNNKADVSHSHNDIYYTESEINEKIEMINASISNSIIDTKTYVDNGDTVTLESANTYTDNTVAQKSQVQIITWGVDD